MSSISFTVYGRPQQVGSKRAFAHPKGGAPLMVDANKKSKPWMAAVASAAAEAMNGAPLLNGPLEIHATFLFKYPSKHYHTGKRRGVVLRDSAPVFRASAPDADKLMRAVGDALSGVAYRDDAQLVRVVVEKRYTESSEGAVIEVSELTPPAIPQETIA